MSASLLQSQTKVTRHDPLEFSILETETLVGVGSIVQLDTCILVFQKTWEVIFINTEFQIGYLGSSLVITPGEISGSNSFYSIKRRQGWTSKPFMRVYVRGVEL